MIESSNIDRNNLFKFPWTKNDNPGGWIEVTDICNLHCPGCFRHTITGHRPPDELKKEIKQLQKLTNCSRISIAGGEPLLYPHIIEIVDFITKNKLKAIILTNGELLTEEIVKELQQAGLFQFYFHVDSNQNRPGWKGKIELEMNELRQHYIDLVNKCSKIKCGFLTTVTPSTLHSLPDIVKWFHGNIQKVIHMAFIAFRGIPIARNYEYLVNGKLVDPEILPNKCRDLSEIDISINEMYEIIKSYFSELNPCAYLKGTTREDSYKFLIINSISSNKKIFGSIGYKTVSLQQSLNRRIHARYSDTIPNTGKEIFFLSLIDKQVRKAFINYLKTILKDPKAIFEKISLQSLVLQQPYEMIDSKPNLCDGCINMMIYNNKLINSCRLDEYRMLGGTLDMRIKPKASIYEYQQNRPT